MCQAMRSRAAEASPDEVDRNDPELAPSTRQQERRSQEQNIWVEG